MSDQMSILHDLAAGRIDAAEAARRIDALSTTPDTHADPTPGEPDACEDQPRRAAEDQPGHEEVNDRGRPQFATHTRESFRPETEQQARTSTEQSGGADEPEVIEEPEVDSPKPQGVRGVEKVAIRSVGRRVRIIGDESVATVSASGPHVLRRTGKQLEVSSDGEIGPSLGGFSIVRPPRTAEDFRTLVSGKELLVRVNPSILVDVEVTGGSLHCSGVPVLGAVRVTVGAATLEGVHEVADALVQTGQGSFRGDFDRGRSRIRVESGSLTVTLGKESNVTARATSQLGRVAWPGEQGSVDEYVVGNGSARLDIGVVMGHASIRDEQGEQA